MYVGLGTMICVEILFYHFPIHAFLNLTFSGKKVDNQENVPAISKELLEV